MSRGGMRLRKAAKMKNPTPPSNQVFAAVMNDHVRSVGPAPAPPKSRRFWNWKLIGGEIILTVLGVYLFLAQAPRLPGMAGLVVGILSIWLLLSEFRGFAVAPKAISFPSRFVKLPILSLRRMSVNPASVRELTVMQDLVQLSGRQNLRRVWAGVAAVSKPWSASAVHERSRSDLSQRQTVPAKTAAKGI